MSNHVKTADNPGNLLGPFQQALADLRMLPQSPCPEIDAELKRVGSLLDKARRKPLTGSDDAAEPQTWQETTDVMNACQNSVSEAAQNMTPSEEDQAEPSDAPQEAFIEAQQNMQAMLAQAETAGMSPEEAALQEQFNALCLQRAAHASSPVQQQIDEAVDRVMEAMVAFGQSPDDEDDEDGPYIPSERPQFDWEALS